jgi:hypothetical protein
VIAVRDKLVKYLRASWLPPETVEGDIEYTVELLRQLLLWNVAPAFVITRGRGRAYATVDTLELRVEDYQPHPRERPPLARLLPHPGGEVSLHLNGDMEEAVLVPIRAKRTSDGHSMLKVRIQSKRAGAYRLRMALLRGERIIARTTSFNLLFE